MFHPAASTSHSVRWAVLDSSVYIGHWEAGRYDELLLNVQRAFIVRHSAVVLSELRRGARGREQRRIVERLHDAAHAIWEPSSEDWWVAGRLVRDIGDRADWETSKRREFQNDALIALTAVRYGATVITANRDDFSLLKARLKVDLIYA